MKIFNLNIFTDKKSIVLVHLFTGLAVFYFLVHPLTVVIYWFEMNDTPISLGRFLTVAPGRIRDSFSFHMTGMALVFIFMGAVVGLGSGLYYKNILQKIKLLQRKDDLLKRNVISILQGGESDEREFKSSLRYDYHQNIINKNLELIIVKAIAGFLNSKGGELLIGVDDDGNVLGLEKDYISLKKKNRDGLELRIFQLVTEIIGIEFSSFIQTSFYDIAGKDICLVSIAAANSPAYVHKNKKTLFFVRTGNSTNPLTIQEAVKYIKSHRN